MLKSRPHLWILVASITLFALCTTKGIIEPGLYYLLGILTGLLMVGVHERQKQKENKNGEMPRK